MAGPDPIAVTNGQGAPRRGRKLSVVVPGLNEERSIPALVERLQPVLDGLGLEWEVIFVDDGSTDGTLALLRALHGKDPRFKALSLSRNFGKEIAAAAGLTYATGDAAVLMDADLQHPPELIKEFVARWNDGFDIVYGQRMDRDADSVFASPVGARVLRRLREAQRHGAAAGRRRFPPAGSQGDRCHEPHA